MDRELEIEGCEGDVLNLNPDKVRVKVPGFSMEKMQGREDIKDIERELELVEEPVLDLRINYDLQKKKVPMYVNMQKQTGRREVWQGEDEG